MNAYVSLNLFNELGKEKMRGLAEHSITFVTRFNKFNTKFKSMNVRFYLYDTKHTLKSCCLA